MPDLVDQVFGEEDPPAEEYYPGSRRKLTAAKTSSEFAPDPWRDSYSTKIIHGKEMRMYTIGALATALGVSVASIRYWTAVGHIPVAPYRLPANIVLNGNKVAGRRLYPESYIDAVVEAFEKRGFLGQSRIEWRDHPDLPIEIRETWTRIFNQTTTSRSA